MNVTVTPAAAGRQIVRFALPLLIPRHSEEAAFGAALTAMAAAGISKDITQAQKIIEYR